MVLFSSVLNKMGVIFSTYGNAFKFCYFVYLVIGDFLNLYLEDTKQTGILVFKNFMHRITGS